MKQTNSCQVQLLHSNSVSEQYLISIVERMPRACSAVISAKILNVIAYLFYALILDNIEMLIYVNFNKNWKNGNVNLVFL